MCKIFDEHTAVLLSPHPSIRLSSQVPQLPEARGLGNLTIDYLPVGGAQLVTIIDNFPLRYSTIIYIAVLLFQGTLEY